MLKGWTGGRPRSSSYAVASSVAVAWRLLAEAAKYSRSVNAAWNSDTGRGRCESWVGQSFLRPAKHKAKSPVRRDRRSFE